MVEFKVGDYVTYDDRNYPKNYNIKRRRIDTYTGVITKLNYGDILHNGSYINFLTIINQFNEEFIDYVYCFKLDDSKMREIKLNSLLNE
jgi:hypothetical protein